MSVYKRIQKLVTEQFYEGDDLAKCIEELIEENLQTLKEDAIDKVYADHIKNRTKEWAGKEADHRQMSFWHNEELLSCIDRPVRIVDEDTGEISFLPASLSNVSQRLQSLTDLIQYHLSRVRIVESEHAAEVNNASKLLAHGFDPSRPWVELRHRDTTCWRCGGGFRIEDPFVHGHCEGAAVYGGTKVQWEHQSCNSSAQQNG